MMSDNRLAFISSADPTQETAENLFAKLERLFPKDRLDSQGWYLLAVNLSSCPLGLLAGIVTANQAHHAATLYKYMISRPAYATPESRQALIRRLREVLVKCVALIGVCKPLEAVFCISDIERDEDKDYSNSRASWQSGTESAQRGNTFLSTIYQHNRTQTISALSSHLDFKWISTNITYGLYLSDHTILTAVETEIVVLTAIALQNLPRETGWHLRGIRRVGVEQRDVEALHICIEEIALFAGVPVDRIPRVADIEHEV